MSYGQDCITKKYSMVVSHNILKRPYNILKEPFRSIIDENKHDILLAFIGSSIILFLLTIYIASPAFGYFYADPFYYMRSLPVFYWIGISITILPLIIPSYNKSKIIFVIILGLYLYGLPVILYNNPRFTDVYSHEASTISLLNHQGFPTENEYYSKEYPGTFLFQSINLLITGIPDFILLKTMSIFLIILPGVIVYLMVKNIYPTMASIAALAFFATFFNDQGHFSPQLFALSLYLAVLFGLQKVSSYNKRAEKSWIIVAMLAIIIVNISNPTSSYFLFANLLAGLILLRLLRGPFRWNNKVIWDRIWTILIIDTVILISWSAYIGVGKGIYEPVDLSTQFSSQLPIHPNPPDESVFISTYLGYAVRICMFIIGIMMLIVLYLRRKFLVDRTITPHLIIIAALFIIALSFIPISGLQKYTSTFLLRAVFYASISWSLTIPFFINLPFRSRVARNLKYIPIIYGILSIILLPITKYGADYLSFIPSSELYMANFIDHHRGKVYELLPLTDNTWQIFFYYHTLNHNSSITIHRPYPDQYTDAIAVGKKPLDYILPMVRDWTYSNPNQLVVSFGYLDSVFVLHEGDKEYLQGLETYMKSRHNLISYSGQARTYITTP
jgi:hypothetical protein